MVHVQGGPGGALCASDDRTCHVQVRCCDRSARKYEGTKRFEALVVLIARFFYCLDIGVRDAQWWMFGLLYDGCAQIRTHIEKVVLYRSQQSTHIIVYSTMGEHHADGAVGLVDVRIGLQAWIVLARPTHVAQGGGAVVAGSGVDARQIDHAATLGHFGVPRSYDARVESVSQNASEVGGVLRVGGGNRLEGSVRVQGAKNSVLKLMAAALLAQGTTTITNVPNIVDVEIMSELLRRLGCEVIHDAVDGTVVITVPERPHHRADYDLVRRMRASICVLGPLVSRCGEADVAMPGGDNIGSRGLDLHIDGLQRMGADVVNEHGYLIATAGQLRGAEIWLDFPSVGATETLVMAAVLAHGKTTIDNAAREPEIIDICTMLGSMGACIEGIGTSTLTIEGVDELHPVEHRTVPDRIVAGTWAVAAAITRGSITITDADPSHLHIALDKLSSAGASISTSGTEFTVSMETRPKAVDIVTLPYPGFPTDLQPQFIALNAIADGAALVTENLFEARFRFVRELARLGADVRTDGHHALIRGREGLSGAPVEATDIRAGAGLVLAGLVADGQTEIYGVGHIDRGYAGLVDDLRALGASVERSAPTTT